MKISKKTKEVLIEEIQFVREKMAQEKNARKKMFYYSAIYSQILRLLNLEYDPHLQFMHLIFNVTYNAVNSRINLIATGDITVDLPSNFFDELDKLLGELVELLKNDVNTYPILEKISNLAYLTTGNGYYLSKKGINVYSP